MAKLTTEEFAHRAWHRVMHIPIHLMLPRYRVTASGVD